MRIHPGTGRQTGISAPESARPSHHPALCHRQSATFPPSQQPWPGPPATAHPARPPPTRAGSLAVLIHECLLAPRQTQLSGGARGPGSRTTSPPGAVCSRCARILPITAGSSILAMILTAAGHAGLDVDPVHEVIALCPSYLCCFFWLIHGSSAI